MTDEQAGSGHAVPAAIARLWERARRWASARGLFIVPGVLGLVALALVVSLRHRAVDPGARVTSGPAAAMAPARPAPAAPASATPGAGRLVRAAVKAPVLLEPDATGRIRIPLTDARPLRLPLDGVPEGWSLKEFTGHAVVEMVRAEGKAALRLSSERTSFALYRDVVVDLTATPWLTWSWKVTRLPRAGDVRAGATDDQAAQVYVVFPKWPAPLTQSDVLGYVWDSRAPVNTRVTSAKAGNVRVIVLQSGDGKGTWRHEQRDVAADYTAMFGHKPPRVGKIALMIDSNDTRSDAESLFRELAFVPRP